LLALPSYARAAVSTKSLTLHHVTDASDLIGSFPQQGSGIVDQDDGGGPRYAPFDADKQGCQVSHAHCTVPVELAML